MSYVHQMIEEGEHQRQDFKMRIEDPRKIARTLSAFANTDGGRLLIGVKDNGSVSGVNAEEEYHMIEAAAEMYCKPAVAFATQVWKSNFKSVLEVQIESSKQLPHFAEDDEGEWHAYQRREDRNVRANGIQLKVWQHEKNRDIEDFQYTWRVEKLFQLLREDKKVGFKKISKHLKMSRKRTEILLAQLVTWGIIEMDYNDSGCHFVLLDEEKAEALNQHQDSSSLRH